jgi:hypothetical protein
MSTLSTDSHEFLLAPGDVVSYHGTLTELHGEYMITHHHPHDLNRLVLVPLQDPGSLRRLTARRISVTPTGAHVPVCAACQHPTDQHLHDNGGHCGVLYCDCGHRCGDLWSQAWARL